MNKTTQLEKFLPTALIQPEIDSAFAQRLNEQLKSALRQGDQRVPRHSIWNQRLVWAVVLLLFIAMSVTIIIGPSRVWAQVQRWLGYFLGEGFVNPESVMVLDGPVLQHGPGNSLTITNSLIQNGMVKVWGEFDSEFANPGEVWLSLDDGSLIKGSWSYEPDVAGTKGILFTFTLGQNNSKITGLKTESGWNIPLGFIPGSEAFPPADGAVLPGADDCQTSHNLQFCAIGTHLVDDSLEILVQISSEDGKTVPYTAVDGLDYREIFPVLNTTPLLIAQDGSSFEATYRVSFGRGAGKVIWDFPLRFEGFGNKTGQYDLKIPGLLYTVPFSDSLTVDVGDNPHEGQVIPLDKTVRVDGLSLHFDRALITSPKDGELTLLAYAQPIDFSQPRFIMRLEQERPLNGQDMYGGYFDGEKFAFTIQIGKSYGNQTGLIHFGMLSATIFDSSDITLPVTVSEASLQTSVTSIPETVDKFETPVSQQALSMETFSETGISLNPGGLLYSVTEEENSSLYFFDPAAGNPPQLVANLPGKLLELFPLVDGTVFYTVGEIGPSEDFGVPKQLYRYMPGKGKPTMIFADFPSNVDPKSLAISHKGTYLSFRSYEPVAGGGSEVRTKLVLLDRCSQTCPTHLVNGWGEFAGWSFSSDSRAWSTDRDNMILYGFNPAGEPGNNTDLFTLRLENFPAIDLVNLTRGNVPMIANAFWTQDNQSIYLVRASGTTPGNTYAIDRLELATGAISTLSETLPWNMAEVIEFEMGKFIDAWSVREAVSNELVIRSYDSELDLSKTLWSKPSVQKADVLRGGQISHSGQWMIYRSAPGQAVIFDLTTKQFIGSDICHTSPQGGFCTWKWLP